MQGIETKGWWFWELTDFFDHRVKLHVDFVTLDFGIRPVIRAQAMILDENGHRQILHFGPQAKNLSFEFWAGPRSGGLHEPRVRAHTDFGNKPDFSWRVVDRDIRQKSRKLDGEFRFASVQNISIR